MPLSTAFTVVSMLIAGQPAPITLERLVTDAQLIVVATKVSKVKVTETTTRWGKPLPMTVIRYTYRIKSVLLDSAPSAHAVDSTITFSDSDELHQSEIGAFSAAGGCVEEALAAKYPSTLGQSPYGVATPVILFLVSGAGDALVTATPHSVESVRSQQKVVELVAKRAK